MKDREIQKLGLIYEKVLKEANWRDAKQVGPGVIEWYGEDAHEILSDIPAPFDQLFANDFEEDENGEPIPGTLWHMLMSGEGDIVEYANSKLNPKGYNFEFISAEETGTDNVTGRISKIA